MEGRINTAKTLHNSYFDGDKYDLTFNNNAPMQVHSAMSSQYDYAVTEDPELLMERKKTAELIHDIFVASPFNDGRFNYVDCKGATLMKVPKDSINEVFYYVKKELDEKKKLNPIEMLIAINEYFEFNYEFVWKKVLTPQLKQEVLEDYKSNGMSDKIEDGASIKLF